MILLDNNEHSNNALLRCDRSSLSTITKSTILVSEYSVSNEVLLSETYSNNYYNTIVYSDGGDHVPVYGLHILCILKHTSCRGQDSHELTYGIWRGSCIINEPIKKEVLL